MHIDTQQRPASTPKWRGFAFLLGCFLGLCAIFALIVTLGEAWQEHAETRWPLAEARIERCSVQHYQSSTGSRRDGYRIDSRVSYFADGAQVSTKILSRIAPSPRRAAFPDPMIMINEMQAWVDAHPPDSRAKVHYNPANHKNALLAATGMPLGGPHTPDNLKLLGGFAAGCVILLAIGGFRPPSSRPV